VQEAENVTGTPNGIRKEGTLGPLDVKVYKLYSPVGFAMLAQILSSTGDSPYQWNREISLHAHMGTIGAGESVDGFALVDHSSRTEGSRLEIDDCETDDLIHVAVKNDGQFGKDAYVLLLSVIPCTNCTGVVCAKSSHCDEQTAQ
jgi:hypothetical protein